MYKPGPYPESLVFDIDDINLYVIVDNDPVLSTMQWVEKIARCMKFFDRLFMHTGHWHTRNNAPHANSRWFDEHDPQKGTQLGLEPADLLPFLPSPDAPKASDENINFRFIYYGAVRIAFSGSVAVPAGKPQDNRLIIEFKNNNEQEPLATDFELMGKMFYALILILQPSYIGCYPSGMHEYYFWQGKKTPFGGRIIYLNDPHIADLIPVEKGARRFANGTIISWLHRDYFFMEELDAHTEYLESLGIHGPEYPTWVW